MYSFSTTFLNGNKLLYPQKAIIQCLESIKEETDINIIFTGLSSKLIIPLFAKIYGLALEHTIYPITLLPKQGEPIISDLQQTEVELEPFEFQPENNVCVGGTFDHLHSGHKLLLTATALVAREKVIIGISRKFNSKKQHADLVYPLSKRAGDVISFLFKINNNLIYSIESIDDFAGPAGKPVPMDAIVLSIETQSGAQAVAKLREEKGLPPLNYYMIPLIMKPNSDQKVSSTLIREEEASHK